MQPVTPGFHGSGPIPNPTQADYEATYDEYRSVIHRIMDEMGGIAKLRHGDAGIEVEYPEPDEDKWREAAEQAIWWHPDVNGISPGEFDVEKMIDQITEEW